jgi:DNA replication protein DnaC
MKIINKSEIPEELLQKIENSTPPVFREAWLESCDQKIKDWAVKEKEKKGLYIYGACGTGKTHSLYAIRKNCIAGDVNSRIINTVELLRLFKLDFNDKHEHNFEDYLEYKGILFIDDIGAEKNSEFVDETLYHLINVRYEKMIPTCFTSNLSLKELAEKNGDRLVSRIAGMCEIIKLEGNDKRI